MYKKIKNVKWCGMRHIQDCRERANLAGLMPAEAAIAESIYDTIAQYRVAARIFAAGKIYTRQTPQAGTDFYGARGTMSAYRWNGRYVETIFSGATFHRATRAISAYPDYIAGIIAEPIWNNYITNGYSTRRGLYAKYTEISQEKIKTISKSHADYCGQETGNSTYDHYARVSMRA